MGVIKRLLAAVLGLTSLALAVHSVAGEIYGVYLENSHVVWDYLNWFLGLGILIALVYHFRRKRAFDRRQSDDGMSFNYLWTNLLLFSSMFLALWFFANWFEELSYSADSGRMAMGFVWLGFNASFVVLGGITAGQLWQDGGDSAESVPVAQTGPPGLSDNEPAATPAGPTDNGPAVASE